MRWGSMKKKDRHRLLKEIIEEYVIEKQEDFVRILHEKGIEVTQATISRDIKELHLIKIPAPAGGYRYSMPPDMNYDTSKKLERLLHDAFISIDYQDYFVIIHTIPGNSFALGALMDASNFEGVFGTIAGDDTLLVICRSSADALNLKEQIIQLI